MVLKSLHISGLATQDLPHTIGQVELKYHSPIIHTGHTVHLLTKTEKKLQYILVVDSFFNENVLLICL